MSLNAIKSFGKNLAVGFATQIVRGWFNEKLKSITPSDLYEAIIENQDLWDTTPDDVKKEGQNYKKTYGKLFKQYEGEITTELLLTWMKEDHLELYSTIINTNRPVGIIWFDQQVWKIKQKILEM